MAGTQAQMKDMEKTVRVTLSQVELSVIRLALDSFRSDINSKLSDLYHNRNTAVSTGNHDDYQLMNDRIEKLHNRGDAAFKTAMRFAGL